MTDREIIPAPSTLLAELLDGGRLAELLSLIEDRERCIQRPAWAAALELLHRVLELPLHDERTLSLDQSTVCGGVALAEGSPERQTLEQCIAAIFPWRKGPFSLCGLPIEAEWRSDRKFARLEGLIPPLNGSRVLDVGCNNGYYLFRLAGLATRRGEAPDMLLGIDPSERFFLQFRLLQHLLRVPRCEYAPLGIEEAGAFGSAFDLVLCLGIVYHQRDPMTALQRLRESMRPGGTLLLESQTIPGDEPVALFAPDRYAKARNVYFVPTPACLAAWAARAGFREVRIVSEEEVTKEEQRQTALAPYESLNDFLDRDDPSLTVEGFPAPRRTIVVAMR